MNTQKCKENAYVNELLENLGYRDTDVQGDNRVDQEKPDQIVTINGCRIGIEVTDCNADGGAGIKGGSALRKQEQKIRQNQRGNSTSYTMSVPLSMRGLEAAILQKINVAAKYDHTQYEKLWLLLVTQLRELGAVASTTRVSQLTSVKQLNRLSHRALQKSPFTSAYLYFALERVVFEWSPSTAWIVRHAHKPNQGPSLKEILQDPEWVQHPDEKASKEVQKVLNEFKLQRRT